MNGNLDAAVLARLRLLTLQRLPASEAILRRALRVSAAELSAALGRLQTAGLVELAGLSVGRQLVRLAPHSSARPPLDGAALRGL